MTKTAGFLSLLLCSVSITHAQQLRDIIDSSLEKAQDESGAQQSPLLDDYGFARRVYLDLTGRIPSESQLLEFVDSQDVE